MKAIAIRPGTPGSVHLRDLPSPSLDEVPDGRGVRVSMIRAGLCGTDADLAQHHLIDPVLLARPVVRRQPEAQPSIVDRLVDVGGGELNSIGLPCGPQVDLVAVEAVVGVRGAMLVQVEAHITAVSNSASQRAMILQRAERRGLKNIHVITADMNDFDIDAQFDRVVSVEMFEHMRNYRELYTRVARWLKPGGKFFKHIFVHRDSPYLFEDRGPGDWMSRFFFSGGMMPSDDLPLFFQDALRIEKRWRWDGRHYEKTSNAWLAKMDRHKEELWPLFEATYGKDFAATWWQRWRIFFMACAELFGFDKGQQWWVSHYLFHKPLD